MLDRDWCIYVFVSATILFFYVKTFNLIQVKIHGQINHIIELTLRTKINRKIDRWYT